MWTESDLSMCKLTQNISMFIYYRILFLQVTSHTVAMFSENLRSSSGMLYVVYDYIWYRIYHDKVILHIGVDRKFVK